MVDLLVTVKEFIRNIRWPEHIPVTLEDCVGVGVFAEYTLLYLAPPLKDPTPSPIFPLESGVTSRGEVCIVRLIQKGFHGNDLIGVCKFL